MLTKIKNAVKKVLFAIAASFSSHFPVQNNKVVFDNFFGRSFGDNPKYIAEEILSENYGWDLVWLQQHPYHLPKGIRGVKYGLIRSAYELATAKVIVSNVRNGVRVKKRPGQIYLQTWHSSSGSKRSEGDAAKQLNPAYIRAAKRDGADCDGIIAATKWMSQYYRKYFWLNPQTNILEYGLPRDDIFFDHRKAVQEQSRVRQFFGIRRGTRVLLYMPTFRDDGDTQCYQLDFNRILDGLEKKTNHPYVALIHLHPNVVHADSILKYDSRVINANDYPDTQELYFAANLMLTDYSSAPFDYYLLNKPVFLYTPDIAEYTGDRALNALFPQLPFPRANNEKELLAIIQNFDHNKYNDHVEAFKKKHPDFNNGMASKKTVAWIKKQIEAQ